MIYVNANAANRDGVSLTDAYRLAAERLRSGESAEETLVLSKGRHYLSLPLCLRGEEYGNRPLTVIGEEGAVITAGKCIDGKDFSPVEGKPYFVYRFPESARDEHGAFPEFRDLAVGGRAMHHARSASAKFVVDSALHAEARGLNGDDRLLYVRPSLLPELSTDGEGFFITEDEQGNRTRILIELWSIDEWQLHGIHAEQVLSPTEQFKDGETGENLVPLRITATDWAVFREAYRSPGPLENCPYWFQNSIALLSDEGEFYYDRPTGTIYIVPYKGTDLTSALVEYPTAETLLDISDTKSLTFKNLTFSSITYNRTNERGFIAGQAGNSCWKDENGVGEGFIKRGALFGRNVENLTVEGCRFENIGADAIHLYGAVENITVENSVFTDVGGSAIRCGEPHNRFDEITHNRNIVIRNNSFRNIAVTYSSYCAIFVSTVHTLSITHNTFVGTGYTAVGIGYSWLSYKNSDDEKYDSEDFVNIKNADISYNYFENFMMRMSDGGAIYVLSGNASGKNKNFLNSMNHNVAVVPSNVGGVGNNLWMIYYHDAGASHWHDYENAVILSPKASLPHSFMYFQISWGGPSFNNLADHLYVIGYRDDHTAEDIYPENLPVPENGLVGRHVIDRNLNGHAVPEGGWVLDWHKSFHLEINPETGGRRIGDLFYDAHRNRLEEVFLYRNFEELSADAPRAEAVRALYEESGCTLPEGVKHPYGVFPE